MANPALSAFRTLHLVSGCRQLDQFGIEFPPVDRAGAQDGALGQPVPEIFLHHPHNKRQQQDQKTRFHVLRNHVNETHHDLGGPGIRIDIGLLKTNMGMTLEHFLDTNLVAETLRKVECGRAPTPSLFTVAAVSHVLGLSLDDVVKTATRPSS